MQISLLSRLAQDASKVRPQADDPFTHTYFAFLHYFQELSQIEGQHVIISANFTYGWMPTMLRLQHTRFNEAAAILNRIRAGDPPIDRDLQTLIDLMNRSIVDVSKLLHFVNPQSFAIWNSRVAAYLYPGTSYYTFHRMATYRN